MDGPEGVDPEDLPEGWNKEVEWQRLNRELLELMNELRIALPGVTVLFAFLLTLPFTSRFPSLTGLERTVYYLTFLSTAISAVLLMAPSAHHRMRFRRYDKDRLLLMANRLALAGITMLALAIGGAVFLVTDILFGIPIAAAVAGAGLFGVGFLWFLLPNQGQD